MFKPIDKSTWARTPFFDHYIEENRCTYSITCNIEITELLAEIKQKNIRLYPAMMYIVTTVANRFDEFKVRFDDKGVVGIWDTLDPSYTVFNEQTETFSAIYTKYDKDFNVFNNNYLEDTKKYANSTVLFPKTPMPQNTFDVYITPWTTFSALNLNFYNDGLDLKPTITMGKFFLQDNTTFIPISMTVHHAVCDGFHVSRFFDKVQRMCHNRVDWLRINKD